MADSSFLPLEKHCTELHQVLLCPCVFFLQMPSNEDVLLRKDSNDPHHSVLSGNVLLAQSSRVAKYTDVFKVLEAMDVFPLLPYRLLFSFLVHGHNGKIHKIPNHLTFF